MEFPFAPMLAFPNPLEPIIVVLHGLLTSIDGVVHNYGWSLIVLALLIKLAFWPLNTMQFKAMLKTQAIAPRIKAFLTYILSREGQQAVVDDGMFIPLNPAIAAAEIAKLQ